MHTQVFRGNKEAVQYTYNKAGNEEECMSHTCFGCHQSAIVLGACAFHLSTLSVLREPYAFSLTSVPQFKQTL